MPYSFTEPVAIQLMHSAHSLIPGINKVVAIYFDPDEGIPVAQFIEHPSEGSISNLLEIPLNSKDAIQKTRQSAKTFTWFHVNDLPFETKKHQEVQMSIFLESESNVLLVTIENEHDGLKDLLYFYFSDNFSLFKLSNTNKSLVPDHKSIIGIMMYNCVKTIHQISYTDRKILRQINENTRSIIDRYKETQDDLKRLTSGAQRNILDICRHLLSEIAEGTSVNYILSSAAAEKLKKFNGEIPELKAILLKAVTFASALDFEGYRDEYRLDEYHIDLEVSKPQVKSSVSASMPSARYAKTVALLDRLEEAARRVLARDLPLTSSNVGNACSKSISAPAISDALKKHRNKVITLLNQYPDRWNLIRSEFKPLINILNIKLQDTDNQERTAS